VASRPSEFLTILMNAPFAPIRRTRSVLSVSLPIFGNINSELLRDRDASGFSVFRQRGTSGYQ
jgi:hypothetical protein